ncbi:MAG: hypothetical protein IIC71_13690 [Acidobacteria bacterium]|nr:hypothetical protein [Acidobacteriota bacterium]
MNLTISPHIRRLVCSFTGDEIDHQEWSKPIGLSLAGYPVTIEYDLDAVAGLAPGTRTGLWRHRNLLPVWNVPAGVRRRRGRHAYLPLHSTQHTLRRRPVGQARGL